MQSALRQAATALLIVLPLAAAPEFAAAKGCLKGAVVGGVAGSVVGHGKVGAVAGCVVGRHKANKADAEKPNQQTTGTAK